ncbi:MAG TPA: hypothetical protein VFV75_05545 [Candidatus Polarisedimenticolaceae bacterium]|nr:hypothetical protein [Candidatus Polarisedimenticolaceae bacterium]
MQRSRPHYTVRVDRLMVGDSRFVIEAALEYRPELSDAQRERLTSMAQLELLLAIQGEEERGRLLGAEAVRVEVAGDEPLHRFFGGRAKAARSPVLRSQVPPLGQGARTGMAARPVQEA